MNSSNLSNSAVERSAAASNDTKPRFKTIVDSELRVVVPNNMAQRLARAWIDAWNCRDLGKLAGMYSDRCEVSSPLVAIIMGEPSGRLFGKKPILEFWRRLCEREERIDHELFTVYRGVRTVVINYRSFLGKNALELMELDESLHIMRSTSIFDQLG
jgi:hypothetical protein